VEGGGGLVLSVAAASKSRESREVEGAVDNVAAGGESIGEDVACAAVAVDILK
jgi:hypothetical protein